jgi:type III restriction enzyme
MPVLIIASLIGIFYFNCRESRRVSSYFVPIAQPKKKAGAKQLTLESEWTQDRVKENDFINHIRNQISTWRKGNYVGITNVTRQLLEYWKNPDRERKLFFCQIEAMETAIYLALYRKAKRY